MTLSDLIQHSAALLAIGAVVEVLHRLAGAKLSPRLRGWLWSAVVLRSLIPPGVRGLRSVSPQSGVGALAALSGDVPFWLLVLWASGAAVCLVRALRYREPSGRPPTPAEGAALRTAFGRLKYEGPLPQILIGVDDRLRAPAVLGPLRSPRLWLPEEWLGEEHEQDLQRALAHELSHLERRDLWRARLTQMWCALFWFHPVAHLAAARVAELREIACDRKAAHRLGESPAAYGSWLARLALAERPSPRAGLALGGRPHALLHRVDSVMRSRAFAAPSFTLRLAECASLGLFLALVLPPRVNSGTVHPAPIAAEDPGCLELRYQVLAELAKTQDTVVSKDDTTSSLSLGALRRERSNPLQR